MTKRLLDTHLLIWAAFEPSFLPTTVREFLLDDANVAIFSMASLWEISIKNSLGKPAFQYDTQALHAYLIASGYEALPLQAAHFAKLEQLPWLHRDPFDRLLIAQASAEGVPLWTADAALEQYATPSTQILRAQ